MHRKPLGQGMTVIKGAIVPCVLFPVLLCLVPCALCLVPCALCRMHAVCGVHRAPWDVNSGAPVSEQVFHAPDEDMDNHGVDFLHAVSIAIVRDYDRKVTQILELSAILAQQADALNAFFTADAAGFNNVSGVS